jgi:hypothetical protein
MGGVCCLVENPKFLRSWMRPTHHPSPLPWGEGTPSTDSDWRNRLVYATAAVAEAKAGSPLRSAPALHRVELNRSRLRRDGGGGKE